MKAAALADRLGDRFQPSFGQISLWLILVLAACLTFEMHLGFSSLEKANPVSILGYLVPAATLGDPDFLHWAKLIFRISAICWCVVPFLNFLSNRWLAIVISVCTWTAYFSYTVAASIYWENLPFFLHKFVLPSWLLLIHALWYHFYRAEIVDAIRAKKFFQTQLYPRWVYLLSVWVVAALYTLSGTSKLLSSWRWGNGLSLQLWTAMYGDPRFWLAKQIVSDRHVSAFFQGGALTLECLSFLAIVDWRLRTIIGIGLLLFHMAVDLTFHIDFRPNMLLVAIFFLPTFALAVDRRPRTNQ
jgi:hypothetical protein